MAKPKLTERQKRFVDEYMIDLNGTQAAIRAGYSGVSINSAKVQASTLLATPNVRMLLDKKMAERSRRLAVPQDRVINELARVGLLNARDLIDLENATVKADASNDDTAAIQSIKVKTSHTADGVSVEREVKMYDKNKALELLGRHLGLFNDKLNITGAVPVVLKGDDDVAD